MSKREWGIIGPYKDNLDRPFYRLFEVRTEVAGTMRHIGGEDCKSILMELITCTNIFASKFSREYIMENCHKMLAGVKLYEAAKLARAVIKEWPVGTSKGRDALDIAINIAENPYLLNTNYPAVNGEK